MAGRPLLYIEDDDDTIKHCIVWFTVILCLCMFMLTVWSMVHFQKYHPDSRTWDQKHKDHAYSTCIDNIGNYSSDKAEKCYLTIYGVPSPDYQPAVAH